MAHHTHIPGRLALAAALPALLALLQGCIYPYEVQIRESEIVVIEGTLVAGDISTFNVTATIPGSMESPQAAFLDREVPEQIALRGRIWVEDRSGGKVAECSGDLGRATLDTRHLSQDGEYKVHFETATAGDYETTWLEMLQAPALDRFAYQVAPGKLSSGNDTKVQILVSLHGQDGGSRRYIATFNETWEYGNIADTEYGYLDNGRDGAIYKGWANPHTTCWNTNDGVSYVLTTEATVEDRTVDFPVFEIPAQDVRLQRAYKLEVAFHSISELAYDYWKYLDDTSTPVGDLFTPIPSSMRGNVYKTGDLAAPVLGFVSASGVSRGSLYYFNNVENVYREPEDFTKWIMNSRYNQQIHDSFARKTDTNKSLYNWGYWPYFPFYNDWYPDRGEGSTPAYWVWIKQECLDCRSLGGTETRPEGWPAHF